MFKPQAARGYAGSADAGRIEPAGEQAYRRSSTELPNDEDLPVTVAEQTGDGAAAGDPGGLARDEGLITQIEAPADPDIYSDFTRSDADYRTEAGEGAAQTGAANPDIHKLPLTDQGGDR